MGVHPRRDHALRRACARCREVVAKQGAGPGCVDQQDVLVGVRAAPRRVGDEPARRATSMVRPDGERVPLDRWQTDFLASRSGTIWGGTAQVQRNIVGERVLGLPKEPGVGKVSRVNLRGTCRGRHRRGPRHRTRARARAGRGRARKVVVNDLGGSVDGTRLPTPGPRNDVVDEITALRRRGDRQHRRRRGLGRRAADSSHTRDRARSARSTSSSTTPASCATACSSTWTKPSGTR